MKKDRLSIERDPTILDLPLVPIANGSTAKLIALAGVITSNEGDIDFTQVHELRRQGRFKELQPPLVYTLKPQRKKNTLLEQDERIEGCMFIREQARAPTTGISLWSGPIRG
eukprot:8807735-Pyramimonas_sp.AAC.1